MEHIQEHEVSTERQGIGRTIYVSWMFIVYVFERFVRSLAYNASIIWREIDLFFGATLFSLGLFGFSAGRYCDGNTAEYLSCTRPSAFYYYDVLHVALIVIGVTYTLLWFQKRRHRADL